MYVQTDRDTLQSIKLPGMDDRAQFSDNNIAQVTESDAAVLLDIDHISEYNPDTE